MQATVTKKFRIESAHFLPGYPGKCANLHGHGWDITLSVSGPVNSDTGFVLDFSELKRLVVEPLKEKFDHKLLNDCIPFKVLDKREVHYQEVPPKPTAENLAEYILGFSISQLAKYVDLWVSEVSVAETPDNIAVVRQALPSLQILDRLDKRSTRDALNT